MKCAILFLVLAVVTVYARPSSHFDSEPENVAAITSVNAENSALSNEDHHSRMKRATCDFPDLPFFHPHDSLCATHCVFLGYKGGNCIGKICHCRDKIRTY